MIEVPDEAIEAAQVAVGLRWNPVTTLAMLEAAAPFIRAQGEREAFKAGYDHGSALPLRESSFAAWDAWQRERAAAAEREGGTQ